MSGLEVCATNITSPTAFEQTTTFWNTWNRPAVLMIRTTIMILTHINHTPPPPPQSVKEGLPPHLTRALHATRFGFLTVLCLVIALFAGVGFTLLRGQEEGRVSPSLPELGLAHF